MIFTAARACWTVFNGSSVAAKDWYAANKAILFNCSIHLVDSSSDSRHVTPLGVYDAPASESLADSRPEVRIIGAPVYRQLKRSVSFSEDTVITNYGFEGIEKFIPAAEFSYGVSQKNQSASELWLSAYIGNYIGNCLSFLNDFLERMEIEPEITGNHTKLLVK